MNSTLKRPLILPLTVLSILFTWVPLYGATGTRHVAYVDSTGHVHQLYSTATGWSDLDLTSLTGAPPAKSGTGLTSVLDSATNYVHIYYQSEYANYGIYGDVMELYGSGTTWHSNDLSEIVDLGNSPGPAAGDALTNLRGERPRQI